MRLKTLLISLLGLSLFSFSSCSASINSVTNISPKDALELIKGNSNAVLIDVRTPDEHKSMRIPGSILIPVDEIKEKIADVVPDKNTTIIVYCRSGKRSTTAAKTLMEMGYNRVLNLGGIIDWPYDTEGDLD
jgi:phage shock operon rhodanese PspE